MTLRSESPKNINPSFEFHDCIKRDNIFQKEALMQKEPVIKKLAPVKLILPNIDKTFIYN